MDIRTDTACGVIVAAGGGTRMGGVSKPLIKLGQKTLLQYVVEAFFESEVCELVIVTPPEDTEIKKAVSAIKQTKKITLVSGGKTRGDSVFLGVNAMPDKVRFACVHDCARPFVTADTINTVIRAAHETGCATACCRVSDTIRYVDEENKKIYTPVRDKLRAIMTPQCFDRDLFFRAYATARSKKEIYTDDCGMLESFGVRCVYEETPSDNIKLTTPSDIMLARAIRFLKEKDREK